MDSNNNLTNSTQDKYYFSYIEQGQTVKEPLELDITKYPQNAVIPLNDNEKARSYIKLSSNTLNIESDLVRSEVANLLGVEMPSITKIIKENKDGLEQVCGVLIRQNIKKTNSFSEERLSNRISVVNNMLQRGIYKKDLYREFTEDLTIQQRPITDRNLITKLIVKGIKVLPFNNQSNPDLINEVISEYIKYLFLDMATTHLNRNISEYSFITGTETNENSVKTSFVKIIPSALTYPTYTAQLKDNEYYLNGGIVDRDALLSTLFTEKNFYKLIKPLIKEIEVAKEEYLNCIKNIIYYNSTQENKEYIEKQYTEVFSKILALSSKMLNESPDGSKIDDVSGETKTRINVLNRINIFNGRYPDQNKQEEKKSELDAGGEGLALKYETEEPKKNGFVSLALVGSAIAFVCGLGFGIAYIIMNLP